MLAVELLRRQGVKVTAKAVAETLGVNPRHVFVASTGVIGDPLPSYRFPSTMTDLRDGLDAAKSEAAARPIMIQAT